jgi:hypothetical protein
MDFTGLFDNPGLRFDPGFEGSDEPADDFEGIEVEDWRLGVFIFARIRIILLRRWLPDVTRG